MNEDPLERIKRKRREIKRQNLNTPLSDNSRAGSQTNVHTDGNTDDDVEVIRPTRRRLSRIEALADEKENVDNAGTGNNIESLITRAHRNKSQELSQKLQKDDPNEVIKEIHEIKDQITEKIKNYKERTDYRDDTFRRSTLAVPGHEEPLATSRSITSEYESRPVSRSSKTPEHMVAESTRLRLQRIKQTRGVQSLKDKAEETIREENETYRFRSSIRRRDLSTRFDSADMDEPDELPTMRSIDRSMDRSESLDKSFSGRRRFRRAAEAVVKEIHIPTADEQFDFFCKTWEQEKKDEIKQKADVDAIKAVEEQAEPPKETATLLELFKDDDWQEVIFTKPNYRTHSEQKKNEEKLLFQPKTAIVPLKRKLGEHTEKPRYLELEGFYVGKKPYVKLSNMNRMENRLVVIPNQLKWFGVDGRIICLPDPIKYFSTRPNIFLPADPTIEASYLKATLNEYDSNKISGSINNSLGKFRIDIDINQLELTSHRLFSYEHVLAFRLLNMFKHYKLTQEQNLIRILTQKLRALKAAENSFKHEMDANKQQNENPFASVVLTARPQADTKKLNAYRYEIIKTRQERNKEMRMFKTLTERIIETWKELKELRHKQQFRNTEIKLIIRKKEVDKDREEEEYKHEILDEFEEMKSIKLEEYEKAKEDYQDAHKRWKFQHTKIKEARKRQQQREEEITDMKLKKTLEEMEDVDKKTLSEEELKKPEKPAELNDEEIYQQIETEFYKSFKEPGYPILFFDIENSGGVTPSEQLTNSMEKTRRDMLARTRLFVKILFNNKLVHTTSKANLKNDFTVQWGQIFNIYMIYWPESIRLQIYEYCDAARALERASKEIMIAEILLPIPDKNCTSQNYDLEKYEFSSSYEFYMRNRDNKIDAFKQSGVLYAGVAWGLDKQSLPLIPPNITNTHSNSFLISSLQNHDAIAALGVAQMQDVNQLAKWIQKSNLDPNDPRNADLINLIRAVSTTDGSNAFNELNIPDYFRLDQLTEDFSFVKDENEFENSRRFRLIEYRTREEPEYRNYKMIPPIERYIQRDVFDVIEKRKKAETDIHTTKEQNEIEVHRLAGKALIQKIREQILKRFRYAQTQKSLSDIVVEEVLPNLDAFGHWFWNLYIEPRRPLYPMRKERKKITGQNLVPEDVHIVLNIVGAFDLPIRKDKVTNEPVKIVKDAVTGKQTKVHETLAGESLVNPYVEVTFQKTVIRTITADGPNPSWNYEIRLPFKAPNNDYTPSSLQTCTDSIYLNVYDEIEVDVLEDDRERGHVVHKQIQRHWLGSLKIPFATLYFNSKIDGTFKLDSSIMMLGYTRDNRLSRVHSHRMVDNVLSLERPISDASYVSLFMTIEPQLLVPEPLAQTYESSENQELLRRAVEWSTKLKVQFPRRDYRTTVMDIKGKTVMLTRYFKAIKPPADLIEDGEASFTTAQNVARFVSLIPHVSDTLIFPGLCDIWSTCDQFMSMLSGDEEEHAVLLTNFFLGLGKKAWLLLGSSITDGSSAYCLSIENAEYTVWYQGKPYKVNEPHNPVRIISALANAENIWANIQQFDEPYRVRFDVNNLRQWQPLFTQQHPNLLQSIQPELLNYFQTNVKHVKEIETKIENKLREKIQEWRPRYITKWNRYASTSLRQILARMEKTYRDSVPVNTEPEELSQILNSYRMSGFPLNMPYSNLNDILDTVYATQVHSVPTSDVEYALAVHINSYSNTILSVWVYVATLTRKK